MGELLIAFRDHLGDSGPSDNAMIAGVERLIEQAGAEFLLAAVDDDSPAVAVAQLRYRFSVWTASPDCWLEDLFVAESARGRGLGAALVSSALERARAHGARRIELDTQEDNVAALALYARFGFSPTSKGGPARNLFLGRRLEDE